jgi:hypothetical protein
MRRLFVIAMCLAMLVPAATAFAEPRGQGPERANDAAELDLYRATVGLGVDVNLREEGYDVVDVERGPRRGGKPTAHVEMVLSRNEARKLRREGIDVDVVTNEDGLSTAQAAALEAANGFDVWRSYSEDGGIEDEIRMLAEQHPDLLKLVKIGESVLGEDILALKLTADANKVKDGKRPAVLYASLQHAREWITVETNRRLLHHYLDNYGDDQQITEIVDTTELWFLLVANPDGYDLTFEDENRLWRKNARDNNDDGVFTLPADGVDLNRNFPTNWGYDNEGSSPNPNSQTYRGPSPASEPETQAYDQLLADVDPVFLINYHSAAELLLYGIGWQVATPSPDDLLHIAVNGTDDNPAVPGYDPDISAELYTTNGDTTDHAAEAYGQMAYTPELDTCESAEDIFPDDEFGDSYCEDEGRSGFEFPDDEALIQAVFEKNLPYALSVAVSAHDPTNPDTSETTGLEPPNFQVDAFEVSYGDPQVVAVETKREFKNLTMHYRIAGGAEQTLKPQEWQGGERYGDNNNTYYAEYRGEVSGASPGDTVEVWFTAREASLGRGNAVQPAQVESDHFEYTLESDSGAEVLIVANEDYEGFAPVQEGVTEPQYVEQFAEALEANGISYDVWDVTAQGVPHDLGVLGHYDAVVWELGDNRLTQEEDDVETFYFGAGPFPDLSVSEEQQYLTVAMRDYLNEGGKVFETGEYMGYYGILGGLGGIYYAINGDEEGDCNVTTSPFDDCLILSDDFAQYYQGVWQRSTFGPPELVEGTDTPLTGVSAEIDGAETPSSGAFTATSEILPVAEFPLFESWPSGFYSSIGPGPLEPFSGEQYAAAVHQDQSWMRLQRTIDLTGASSAELAFKLSYDIESSYDHLIVEARTVGQENWTTLPDVEGNSTSTVPAECAAGFYIGLHPALGRYLTIDAEAETCQPSGTSGDWNGFTGNSGGWTDATFDLSAYAGEQVEVTLSYVTDPASGGFGAFVDDTVVTVDGAIVDENGFESGAGAWTIPGSPDGSPENAGDWQIAEALFDPQAASVTTEDTVTFGFGFEAIATAEERATVMGRVMDYLLGTP